MALRYAVVSNFRKSVKNRSALLSISSPPSQSFFQFSTFHGFRSTGFDPEDNNNLPALGRDLMCNNKHLMIMVQEFVLGGANRFSVLSAQDNSFKQLQSGNRLPNLCRLTTGKRRILATCNTWMLVYDFRFEDDDVGFLWEPATDELKTVDFGKQMSLPGVTEVRHLCWGLGFDPVSGDYKVVNITRLVYGEEDRLSWHRQGEITALVMVKKTGLWKKVVFPHKPNIKSYLTSSIHINGFCYMVAYFMDFLNFDFAIIPFDCVKDEFPASLIPMPPGKVSCRKIRLAEFHGSLAAIVYDQELKRPFGFEIWVWKEGSWSLQLTSHIPVAVAGVFGILGFFKNETVILITSKEGELLLYNIVTKDLKNLGISGARPYWVNVYPFYS